uniref:RNA polymerase beta subunit protein b n=1 Tax=Parallela transversalis TaxID=163324 RepID=UPI0010C50C74|nr:RNA polymerase beta subunit protein b [Parallela transversalis]AYQ22862.1 RNA polymerase beta subunit protein b [Parallela transversalis]
MNSFPMKKFITKEYNLEKYHRSNQDTCMVHRPSVREGDWIQSGDLLADSSATQSGELTLGRNILLAYMPWEGYNYEDAILISERLVYDDIFSSIHIEKYEVEARSQKYGVEEITRELPDIEKNELNQLDKDGIIKLGSWIQEGDILVGKITPIPKKSQSQYQKLLYTILEKKFSFVRDSSLRAPKGLKAKVIDIQILRRTSKNLPKKTKTKKSTSANLKLPIESNYNSISSHQHARLLLNRGFKFGFLKQIKAFSLKSVSLQRKYTLAGRFYGSLLDTRSKIKPNLFNKSNFSLTAKFYPSLRKENAVEKNLGLNPNSAIHLKSTRFSRKACRRKSKKTLLSTFPQCVHIYLADKRRIQVGDKMAGRHGNKGIISQILPREDMPYLPDGTAIDMVLNPLGVPSRMNVGQIYESLLGLAGKYLGQYFRVPPFDEIYGAEASRSFVYNKLYEARQKTGNLWLLNPNHPGKLKIFDGRTGEAFDQAVTVGIAYMLKLVHLVDDKIHCRSTGPYSLLTQQPLRGRSKQGGQRLGEMEVWALEGYGAAFLLLEMLTIKSDDIGGRVGLWANIILHREIYIGTPESFKVLVCELQALCLDIGIFRLDSKGVKKQIDNLIKLS